MSQIELVDDETPAEPPPQTVVEQLAQSGHPITLLSGQRVSLRYSMLSLRRLEHRFGSLGGISAELKAAQEGAQRAADGEVGVSSPVFTILTDTLAPGLLHVKVRDDAQRVMRLGECGDALMEQLDPARLQQYVEAFATALSQAFGTQGEAVAKAALEAAAGSLGDSGTTSQPSSPDDQTGSSGA
jgi:hypothetical protein